jgi:hypothetical protein
MSHPFQTASDVRKIGVCPECDMGDDGHRPSCSKVSDEMRAVMAKVVSDQKRDDAEKLKRAAAMPTFLATLSLFREPTGEVQITVASAPGALAEYRALNPHLQSLYPKPIDYVETLIVAAGQIMEERRK